MIRLLSMVKLEKKRKIKLWMILLPLLLLPGMLAYWKVFLPQYELSVYLSTSKFEDSGRVAGEFTEIWPAPKEKSVERILKDDPQYSLKKAILESYTAEELQDTDGIEVKPYNDSVFLAVVERQKDWWEDLVVGKIENGIIKYLDITNPPTENSILSARWTRLKGFTGPILEVYGQTHMGNGNIYLYKVDSGKLTLIFSTVAVKGSWTVGSPTENVKKYGYVDCSETYKNGHLTANYPDLNNDGISDVVLTGINVVTCEKYEGETEQGYAKTSEVKVSETPIKLTSYISYN